VTTLHPFHAACQSTAFDQLADKIEFIFWGPDTAQAMMYGFSQILSDFAMSQ
jgi:hypothetical protein